MSWLNINDVMMPLPLPLPLPLPFLLSLLLSVFIDEQPVLWLSINAALPLFFQQPLCLITLAKTAISNVMVATAADNAEIKLT
ncbi:hypothetical protein J4727_14150 [Providencia rettgeri]|uniref:Uncharacterized protein n=1 Tax=Providencia rettgeri TaxID=587 RepID=A0A939NC69_PRORE|nr:hypothetical protein [Providencia rettgeri]